MLEGQRAPISAEPAGQLRVVFGGLRGAGGGGLGGGVELLERHVEFAGCAVICQLTVLQPTAAPDILSPCLIILVSDLSHRYVQRRTNHVLHFLQLTLRVVLLKVERQFRMLPLHVASHPRVVPNLRGREPGLWVRVEQVREQVLGRR